MLAKAWPAQPPRWFRPLPSVPRTEVGHVGTNFARDTAGLQSWLNTRQFRAPFPSDIQPHWYHLPDVTYEARMAIHGGDRDVELIRVSSIGAGNGRSQVSPRADLAALPLESTFQDD